MMALYKANPRAFYKKNVNALMAGKTLKTPSDADINSLSKAQANTEFYFQHDVWTGKRKLSSKTNSKTGSKLIPISVDDEKKAKHSLKIRETERSEVMIFSPQ